MTQTSVADTLREYLSLLELLDDAYWEASSIHHKDMLYDIFNLAETFRSRLATGQSLEHVLRGKVMASVFYEVSTSLVLNWVLLSNQSADFA